MSVEMLLEETKHGAQYRTQFIKDLFASLDDKHKQTDASKIELFYYLHRQLNQNHQAILVELLKISDEDMDREINIFNNLKHVELGSDDEIKNHVIETLIDKKVPEFIGPEGMAILEILNLCSFKKRPWLSTHSSQEKGLADKQKYLKDMINKLHENRHRYEN